MIHYYFQETWQEAVDVWTQIIAGSEMKLAFPTDNDDIQDQKVLIKGTEVVSFDGPAKEYYEKYFGGPAQSCPDFRFAVKIDVEVV